jgi:release factor glutamine methyltransferase
VTATLGDLVRQAAARLQPQLGSEQNAALDAEVLARHVLGWDRARWLSDSRRTPPPGFEEAFEALVRRRLQFEPVAYLTGTREFFSLDFEVTPAVLIPRPETESVVEEALPLIDRLAAGGHSPLVADVGTGSGCIAVSLAVSRPNITLVATDTSEAALAVAARNAKRHQVDGRVMFVRTSLLDAITRADIVVSNLPYVPLGGTVMPDVWMHEPAGAVFGGEDGLDLMRVLLREVANRHPTPPLVIEFGQNQYESVRTIAEGVGLRITQFLDGPRVAVLER